MDFDEALKFAELQLMTNHSSSMVSRVMKITTQGFHSTSARLRVVRPEYAESRASLARLFPDIRMEACAFEFVGDRRSSSTGLWAMLIPWRTVGLGRYASVMVFACPSSIDSHIEPELGSAPKNRTQPPIRMLRSGSPGAAQRVSLCVG